MPVIDLTGRSLHYLYSSWLNVTPYTLQMLLNQFSNWVFNRLLDQSRSFGWVEFTQPLGVGLGLAVRIKNQYSHPVCTGRCTDNYMTINDMREYHSNTGYLLGNVDMGTQEFAGTGNCVNNRQMRQTDESQMMTSRRGHTSQSHKRIAQTNCTKQDDITSKNANDKQCFGMLQSNSGAYGVPETC